MPVETPRPDLDLFSAGWVSAHALPATGPTPLFRAVVVWATLVACLQATDIVSPRLGFYVADHVNGWLELTWLLLAGIAIWAVVGKRRALGTLNVINAGWYFVTFAWPLLCLALSSVRPSLWILRVLLILFGMIPLVAAPVLIGAEWIQKWARANRREAG
jgi:hypothetical protein